MDHRRTLGDVLLVHRRGVRSALGLLALGGQLVRPAGFLLRHLRGALMLLGNAARFWHRPGRRDAKPHDQREKQEVTAWMRHREEATGEQAGGQFYLCGRRRPEAGQAKKGLFRFSSPTVVSGPWPGQTTVSSLRVMIWERLVPSASA